MRDIKHLGFFKKLRASDKEIIKNHFISLDAEGRRLRFEHEVSDAYVSDYVDNIDDEHHLIHGFFKDGDLCGLGELVKISERWQSGAEAAFSVNKEYRNAGVGGELVDRILNCARNREVPVVHVCFLTSNGKMQHLASKNGAKFELHGDEIIAQISPSNPNYFSYWEEALNDGSSLFQAAIHNVHKANRAA